MKLPSHTLLFLWIVFSNFSFFPLVSQTNLFCFSVSVFSEGIVMRNQKGGKIERKKMTSYISFKLFQEAYKKKLQICKSYKLVRK